MLSPNEVLLAARVAAGVSQAELARRAGLAATTVQRSELLERVSPRTLRSLAAALEPCGLSFLPDDGVHGPGLMIRDEGPLHPHDVMRGARHAIRMDQGALAGRAGIGVRALSRLESGRPVARRTLVGVIGALESAGVAILSNQAGAPAGFRIRLGLVARDDLRF